MNRKAHTFIELLVSFVVGAVLILMIGSVINIGSSSYQELRHESEVQSDLSYAYRFMRNRVREAEIISQDTPGTPSWEGNRILLSKDGAPQGAFGIYTGTESKDFVYLNDKDDVNTRQILLTVPTADAENSISFVFSQDDNGIIANLYGIKNKVAFNIDSSIIKRIEDAQ